MSVCVYLMKMVDVKNLISFLNWLEYLLYARLTLLCCVIITQVTLFYTVGQSMSNGNSVVSRSNKIPYDNKVFTVI